MKKCLYEIPSCGKREKNEKKTLSGMYVKDPYCNYIDLRNFSYILDIFHSAGKFLTNKL